MSYKRARVPVILLVLFGIMLITSSATAQWTENGSELYATSATFVGVGTSNPAPNTLSVFNSANAFFGVKSTNFGGAAGTALAAFLMDRGNASSGASLNFRTAGVDNWIMGMGAYAAGSDFQIGNSFQPLLTLTAAGNLSVTGSITGATVLGAVYQDLAEWVPSTTEMAPGTVVVLNPEAVNQVMPSSIAYDTMVAGVVSAQPGIILGRGGEGKAQIATTGRVKVLADAGSGAINVGDLLVTSDVSGLAMKSEPMEIGGRQFHQPGTILGKALEPLSSGRGEILVLLSLQ